MYVCNYCDAVISNNSDVVVKNDFNTAAKTHLIFTFVPVYLYFHMSVLD